LAGAPHQHPVALLDQIAVSFPEVESGTSVSTFVTKEDEINTADGIEIQ
jgi:hypothetical protein